MLTKCSLGFNKIDPTDLTFWLRQNASKLFFDEVRNSNSIFQFQIQYRFDMLAIFVSITCFHVYEIIVSVKPKKTIDVSKVSRWNFCNYENELTYTRRLIISQIRAQTCGALLWSGMPESRRQGTKCCCCLSDNGIYVQSSKFVKKICFLRLYVMRCVCEREQIYVTH